MSGSPWQRISVRRIFWQEHRSHKQSGQLRWTHNTRDLKRSPLINPKSGCFRNRAGQQQNQSRPNLIRGCAPGEHLELAPTHTSITSQMKDNNKELDTTPEILQSMSWSQTLNDANDLGDCTQPADRFPNHRTSQEIAWSFNEANQVLQEIEKERLITNQSKTIRRDLPFVYASMC